PMMSFQRVTLESSSYCTFTWCRVKFPGSQCLGTGMTRKEHWNDIIGATFMTSFFFLDPSSQGTGMTKK
ncbi:MAG: hypothetical protein LBE46_04420, partial [Wolbachia pipientis]|nr:hypothetical protein [Wolbachia pipientis]